ncbi:MAG: DedA family protein [Nitrospira sp.]|nr:DedA family protein [Nitrospira sp.]MCB9711754.1 DedA family protein [Nitrospiraceae bacterium]MDR4488660.1 DedA family protein [Nitrospirales bacterium]MCA9474267.1 DedA family protein [Nitrospira sp.]MCA9479332.1 DedA family protein [Nitrospira sp.]
MLEWGKQLYDWMLSWADSPYGGFALFGLAFAESSFFPLPPDVLLIALTLGDPSQGMWFAAIATAGSVLGGMFGYGIGWSGGRPILKKLMGEARMNLIHHYFQRYEAWAILIAGFTPIPYKVFTIGAGAFFVNFRTFCLASLVSRGGRFFLVAGAIQLIGPWVKELIEKYFNIFSIVFMILLVAGFWIVKYQGRKFIQTTPTEKR